MNVEVGNFRQTNPAGQWALSRYLIGRVIGEYVAALLYVIALGALASAILVYLWGAHAVAVLLTVLAFGVLLVRGVFAMILRAATGAGVLGVDEARLRVIVRETRRDVLAELRRIAVPHRSFTVPLLAFRLISRRRRGDTIAKLRRFDSERAVSAVHRDQLYLIFSQQH